LDLFFKTIFKVNKKRKVKIQKQKLKIMKEQNDVTKVEFLITLNNNFVVQRFFNVKGYNPKTKGSVELMNYMFGLRQDLQTQLRNKCAVYMLENRFQIEEDSSVLVKNILRELTDIFSAKNLSYNYLNYSLV